MPKYKLSTRPMVGLIKSTQFGEKISIDAPTSNVLDLSFQYMCASGITSLAKLFCSAKDKSEVVEVTGSMARSVCEKAKSLMNELFSSFKGKVLDHLGEVTELNLANTNYLVLNKDTTFPTESLKILLSNSKIHTLNLSHNALLYKDPEVVRDIVLVVLNQKHVKHLILKQNNLDQDFVSSIVKQLKTIEHPITIELSTVGKRLPDTQYSDNIFMKDGILYCNQPVGQAASNGEQLLPFNPPHHNDFWNEDEGYIMMGGEVSSISTTASEV